MEDCIQVSHLIKKYKQFTAVDDISFKVEQGSIFAFLGPNGAGKSTTMNILSTLMRPTDGRISIQGYQYQKDALKIKNIVGFVFQENVLDEECTVYENLKFRGSLYHLSKSKLEKNIQILTEQLGLNDYLHSRYKHCSGGQKRLVMIARALIHEPKLIILDEPTTGLDPQIRKLVWERLLQYQKKRNLTIFFSSHYIEEAMIADQICILNQGKIFMMDNPTNLINRYGQKKLTMLINEEIISMEVKTPLHAISILNQRQKDLTAFECVNSSLEDIFLRTVQKLEKVSCF